MREVYVLERVRCYKAMYQRHIWQTLNKFWRLFIWNETYYKSHVLIYIFGWILWLVWSPCLSFHFLMNVFSLRSFKFVDLTKVPLLYVYGLCLCFRPFVHIFMIYFLFSYYMLFTVLYPIHTWFIHNIQNLNLFSSFLFCMF